MLHFSKGPNRAGVSRPHPTKEIIKDSETFCLVVPRISNDGQSPNGQQF
jgi:hypothetical protein